MVGGPTFRIDPPIAGNWKNLGERMAPLLLSRLAETGYFADSDYPYPLVRVLPLDFYPGWILCDFPTKETRPLADDEKPAPGLSEGLIETGRGCHSFLYGADGFTALDGSSAAIHRHNAVHGIDLSTPENVISYFRFFCFFVRGDAGPFEVADNPTTFWLSADADGKRVPALAEPPQLSARTPEGGSSLVATIFHAGQLFHSRFLVAPNGDVSMNDDDVVAAHVVRRPALSFVNTLRFLQEANIEPA